MNTESATKNTEYLTLPEFAKESGESMASVMCKAGKESQRTKPQPFKDHYVVINSKGDLYLIHPTQIGAFE